MHRSGSTVDWYGRLLQYAALPFAAIALFACQGSEPLGPEPNPPPQLESIDPASIPIGGATSISASGSDFDSSSVVRWEGEDRPTTYVSPWELRASLQEDDVAEEGEYAVTVWNPEPGGGESEASRVEVTLGGTIDGRVAVDGEGIPGVEVRLVGADDVSRGGSTEDGGEFRFRGLPKGTYSLDFELPRVSRIAFPDSAETVELATDTSKARVDFEGEIVEEFPETEWAVVRGSVRDENGDPLPRAWIRVRMAGLSEASPYALALELPGTETASTHTDSEGRYEVEFPAGDLEVEARAPDRAEDDWLRSFEALDWDGRGDKRVDGLSVSAGDTAAADFAWISCIEGSLEFGEEIETELTAEDCAHSGGPRVREVWTLEGGGDELVDLVSEGVWCEPLILLDPDLNEVARDSHGCVGGELWISTTLYRDGTYYLVAISDLGVAAHGGADERRLFADRTSPWSAVVAGGRHSCGISPEGTAWCWGDNSAGQLGDGTSEGSATPVAVAGSHTFESLSAGAAYTCGVTTGGELYCWGANVDGQLGDGTTTARSHPVRVEVGATAFEEVSASLTGAHTCAVDAGGDAWCWGANGSGQLGDGSTTGAKRPVRVAADARFREIAPGGAHTCALTDGGAPFCWGANDRGQLGNGTTESSRIPRRVSGELSAGALAAGREHSCVIDPDAPLDESSYCWGRNETTGEDRLTAVNVVYDGMAYSGGDASWLAAGGDRTCAVVDHGEQPDRTYCWQPGWSESGWTGGWTEYASVSVGGEGTGGHVCAVRLSGSAHCWGANGSGQLGRGTFEDSEKPRPVAPRPEETLHALTTGSRPSP